MLLTHKTLQSFIKPTHHHRHACAHTHTWTHQHDDDLDIDDDAESQMLIFFTVREKFQVSQRPKI